MVVELKFNQVRHLQFWGRLMWSFKMKLHKNALLLHRYAGIIAGFLLLITCLTGSLLVFETELEHFLHPQLS